MPPWLPNAVSCVRALLVPLWYLTAAGSDALGLSPNRTAALTIVAVIGASDVVDGWLARRFQLSSSLGAAIDATADKLAQLVVIGALAIERLPDFPAVPLWFLASVLLRDAVLIVGLGLIWARRSHLQVRHRWHGKLASLGMFSLMLALHLDLDDAWLTGALAAESLLLLTSTALYARDGMHVLMRGAPVPG